MNRFDDMIRYDREGRQFVGYWRHSASSPDELPNPADFVDLDWSVDECAAVVLHLQRARPVELYMGRSPCRLCGLNTPGSADMTLDNTWVWPSGFVHYLLAHGVRPPDAFVAHVLSAPETPNAFVKSVSLRVGSLNRNRRMFGP